MQAQAVAQGKRHLAREASRWRAEGGLVRDTRFRRFLLASALLHVSAGGYAVWSPSFAAVREPRALSVVMVDPSLPPPPVPAPPPPAPPEPEPPQEVPEPPQVKPTPPQQVEEAVVIPPVPRDKPRERPKPPPAPPEPPKPTPPRPPTPPPPSAEQLISQLRDRVGATDPRTGVQGSSEGEAEIDAYRQQVLSCFYSKWIGIQRFRRRRDLQVEFELRVAPDGAVISADKVKTSGEPFLDDSAERAIQRCSPLPPPPPNQTRFRFIFIPGEIT